MYDAMWQCHSGNVILRVKGLNPYFIAMLWLKGHVNLPRQDFFCLMLLKVEFLKYNVLRHCHGGETILMVKGLSPNILQCCGLKAMLINSNWTWLYWTLIGKKFFISMRGIINFQGVWKIKALLSVLAFLILACAYGTEPRSNQYWWMGCHLHPLPPFCY